MAEPGGVLRHHFRDLAQQKAAAGLGMWLFIAQEVMFFGTLFGAYAVYRALYYHAYAEGSLHLNWKIGAFNTVVLIGSSLTMALGVHAAALGKGKQAAAWILATIGLGSVFLGVKVVEYREKFEHHLVPGAAFHLVVEEPEHLQADPEVGRHAQIFFTLYFAMTGLHAFHMVVGIPLLAWLAWKSWGGAFTAAYSTPVEMVGLYWHFVDIVWIFLFPLLYLVGHH